MSASLTLTTVVVGGRGGEVLGGTSLYLKPLSIYSLCSVLLDVSGKQRHEAPYPVTVYETTQWANGNQPIITPWVLAPLVRLVHSSFFIYFTVNPPVWKYRREEGGRMPLLRGKNVLYIHGIVESGERGRKGGIINGLPIHHHHKR